MASAFGHAVAAIAIGKSFPKTYSTIKFWILGSVCAIFPDADVISHTLGVPYEHLFGHRGITHSIAFALLFGAFITMIFYRSIPRFSGKWFGLTICFFLCTLSHSILDAMTSGGMGVAFFAPFENSRYFFPWRPIQVSPIGVESFFGKAGLKVIKSEFVWIGIPSLAYYLLVTFFRNFLRK